MGGRLRDSAPRRCGRLTVAVVAQRGCATRREGQTMDSKDTDGDAFALRRSRATGHYSRRLLTLRVASLPAAGARRTLAGRNLDGWPKP